MKVHITSKVITHPSYKYKLHTLLIHFNPLDCVGLLFKYLLVVKVIVIELLMQTVTLDTRREDKALWLHLSDPHLSGCN